MSNKLIAVQGCKFDIYQNVQGDVTGATVTPMSPPSQKVLCSSKGAYFGTVQVMLAPGCSCADGFTLSTPVTFNIQASGVATTLSQKLLRLNDKANGQGTGVQGNSSKPEVFTCEVTDAGQTKAFVGG